ncbi:MAG: glycosyltransferase family 2 protein [Bacteroides sp.]|nr:glycosyltransferase family 2 protein [Bacteroides sp.]
MKKEYILSIVIPTKNRYPYLFKLLELIDSFNFIDVEIVIQDNNERNEPILSFFEMNGGKPSYVTYQWQKESIPISLNSDYAILNSHGEYVCFIGDDDGVSRYIVDCCKWMKENNIECVVPKGYTYLWPDAVVNAKLQGSLEYMIPNKEMVICQTKDVLELAMNSGMVNRGNLPLLYHGIVKRTTLDKIWNTCGSYFPGASPDIANGVALCLVMNSFAVTTFPYAYSGKSQTVGGGVSNFKHQVTLDLKSLPFLPENIDVIWNPRIPKIWAACSIWCESATEAMHAMKRDDLIDKINYEALYVEFITLFFYYRGMAYDLTKSKFNLFLNSSLRIMQRYANALIRLFKRKVFNKYENGQYMHFGLDNIIEANTIIESICEKKKYN